MKTKMGRAENNWQKFLEDLGSKREVWTLRNNDGNLVITKYDRKKVIPFWSSKYRAQKIRRLIPDYAKFDLDKYSLEEFMNEWIPYLKRERLLVGVNWFGEKVTGFDLQPDEVFWAIKNMLDYKYQSESN